jgi:hypothetical protein
VNGESVSGRVAIKIDPRVKTSQADLQKAFDLSLKLYAAVGDSSQAVNQARSVHEQLEDLAGSAPPTLKEALEALNGKISELLDGRKSSSEETETALSSANSDVIALYKEVEKADAAPTVAQQQAFTAVSGKLASALREWEELKRDQIANINQQLHSAGKPEIRLDLPPREPEHAQNEE